MVTSYERRVEATGAYVKAYRRYCWPVNSLLDLKLAPFHLLASEGAVHGDRDHNWHREILGKLAEQDKEMLVAKLHRILSVEAAEEVSKAVRWWEELTDSCGEGMVVKSLSFIAKSRRGLMQPAVKCRGKEQLRIIYEPKYTELACPVICTSEIVSVARRER